MNQARLQTTLEAHRQTHLLAFWDALDDRQRGQLSDQLSAIDWNLLDELIAGNDEQPDFAAMAIRAQSPPAVGLDGSGVAWSSDEATRRGESALRQGKLAAVLVAGGQGTRLGFDQPKGMYPIGPVSGRSLFQIYADRLLAIGKRFGVSIPLYVMTSDATDEATRQYFDANARLGLAEDQLRIFRQGTMPAVDRETGKVLLADRDSLALSPDGHGGTVAALVRSGSLAEMRGRGIEHLFYFQVDNPLVHLMDPTLIGHHLMAGSELTTQVVRKRYATERVGNVVAVDGRVRIIEYSDLPESAANMTAPDGSLKLWAGNIAVHVLDLDFVDRSSRTAIALPFHRAIKKVPFIDAAGRPVTPEQPNAIKFERFIFDLLPMAENAIVVEASADTSFAPVKNADGAENDTPSQAKGAISDLHAGWLRQAGAEIGPNVLVEIAPHVALGPQDLIGKIKPGMKVDDDRYIESI